MSEERVNWENRLKEPPFAEAKFSEELRMNVRRRLDAPKRGQSRSFRRLAGTLGVMIGLGIAIFWAASTPQLIEPAAEPRQTYYKDGRQLLQVFPDPEMKAGQTYGYIFSFAELGVEEEGKTLAIEAVHLATDRRETVIKPYVLTPEALANTSFERYTASFALPLEGFWQFEVLVDGTFYADAIVSVGQASWEPSGTFAAENYEMTGVEGKVGFINPGFIAGHTNKYMWHFWGSDEALGGRFEVLAVKQGSHEIIPVFEADSMGGANNGATRHMPSGMSLPEPGLWRLLPYVDGKLIESIVVDVKKQ